uniref:Serpin domain-containing protein n=1 Tax=Romanomermis culicivorax TaxID=13658 RepID=A0A915I1F8_ROMCU
MNEIYRSERTRTKLDNMFPWHFSMQDLCSPFFGFSDRCDISLHKESMQTSDNNDLSRVISDFVVASLKTPQLLDGFYFENKIFSPISMILCLSMVYSGSTGDTKSEMTTIVYKNLRNEENFYQYIQRFLSKMDETDGANFTLDLLNSILVQQNVNVSVAFSEKLTKNFRTQIYGVNFADERARSNINRYVDEATKGKIGGDFLGPGSVTVPKFKLKSKIDLKNLLIKLGVKKLFDPRSADLSPIDGTRTLYASDAQHSASIEV